MLSLILTNAAILCNALFLFNVLNKKPVTRFTFVMGMVVLYFSQIIIFQVILGIFGLLNVINLVLITVLSASIIAIIGKKEWKPLLISSATQETSWYQAFKKILPGILLLLPAVIVLLIRFFNGVLQIPLEFDALTYHLPIVLEWFKTGSLTHIYYSGFPIVFLGYYPSNFELVYLWYFLPLANDFFANLLNLPLLLLFSAVIYDIAKKFGAQKRMSFLVAILPLYIPIFLQQNGTIFVDIFFALMFLLAINFLYELYHHKSNILYTVLFGLSLGLFIGTKYLGIVYSLPLIVAAIIIFLHKPRQYKLLLCSIGSIFLTGSFFYIRNWIDASNPVFPLGVSVGSYQIFAGEVPQSTSWLLGSSLWNHLTNRHDLRQLAEAFYTMTDLPGVLIFLSFLITFGIFLKALIRKNKARIVQTLLLLVGGALYFLLYSRAPYTFDDLIHNIRYALPFLTIGILNLAFLASYFKKNKIFWYGASTLFILAAAHSTWNLFAFPAYKVVFDFHIIKMYWLWFIVLAIGFSGMALAVWHMLVLKKHTAIFLSIFIISCVLSIAVMNFGYQEREKLSAYFYDQWYPEGNEYKDIIKTAQWFDQNNPTATIAYSGFNVHYPLFGRNFQREVDYININNCRQCRYKDYLGKEGLNRNSPEYDAWIFNLKAKNKQYVMVKSSVAKTEFAWIQQHPESFEQVVEEGSIYTYKFKQ